jgi:hypothetical protein
VRQWNGRCKPEHVSRIPPGVVTELRAAHDALRELIDRCDQLADELDSARIDPARLAQEVSRLRTAFAAHNRYEEQFLRPLVTDGDPLEAGQVTEYRRVAAGLGNAATQELRLTLEQLRRDLAAEDRYFQSP